MLEALLNTYPWFDHPEGIKFAEVERNARRSVGHWLFLPGRFSALHRLGDMDEVWAIHAGALVLHVFGPAGDHRALRLGMNVAAGEVATAVVPAGHWQAAELAEGAAFAFGSNLCVPGFRYDALEFADGDALPRAHSQHATLLARLTRR